ncbi:MAG: Spy/CpxP family protein refolding chaperone [Caldimonas sp.]
MMTMTARIAQGDTRRVRAVMIGMAMTLLAAISVSAWAQPAPPPPAGMEGGPGVRHHGMHGGMGGMMFGGSPRAIDHMLDGLGASDAQRTQIKQIVAQAATDIKAQAAAGRGLRQRGMQIFTAPTVDANAAEQVRQQMLQQHDQMSRRVTQAMIAVANVLTPEQRAKVGERMKDRQARMEERMKRMERDGPRR